MPIKPIKTVISYNKNDIMTFNDRITLVEGRTRKQCNSNGDRYTGEYPDPTLYKGLDTHQHSKNHKIRGYSKGNLHALEIGEKGVFLAEKAMISDFFLFEKRGTVSQIC